MMGLRKRIIAGILVVVFLFCCSAVVSALKTTPSYQDVGTIQKGKQYQQIFSLHNDGAKPEKIVLGYDSFSKYFEPYTKIQPQQLVLYPGETQNIQITFEISDIFGPQIHSLNIVNSLNEKKLFSIEFDIEGSPIHDLRISDVSIPDVASGRVVPIDIILVNDGNIISYATPQVIIEKDKQRVGSISFESLLQIQPLEEYALTLTYGDELPLGEYALRVFFDYDELYMTNEIVRNFAVLEEENFFKNIYVGEDIHIFFDDLGVEGGTYVYELSFEGNIIHEAQSDVSTKEAIIDGEYFEEGQYELKLFLNPEFENREYLINIDVSSKDSRMFILYIGLTFVFLFVLYLLNLHHVLELIWIKHLIRKERIKIQLMEHRLNKLINKTQRLVSTVRLMQ